MNEIIQNRALRGLLTLFVGVMLALSIGLMMKSAYPAPDEITAGWVVVTFLVLFAVGLCLAIGSTVWRQRLAVLSGGIFLAGTLVIADAAFLNFEGLEVLDTYGYRPRFGVWLVVLYALIASISLLALGWWRFHGEAENRDGQRLYTILAAVLPVWFVGVAVFHSAEKLRLSDNKTTIAYCATFFAAAAVCLAVGMVFSRQLGLLSSVLSLSAIIMVFASVIASIELEDFLVTAFIALAATIVAMFVGYKAFSRRTEQVESVELHPVAFETYEADTSLDKVLVLYASGETPPSDAMLVEVPLGNGIVYRGFAAHRSTQPPAVD